MTEEDWEQSLKGVNEDIKKWVDEEIFKVQYGVVKNIIQKETQMTEKQPSYSQCPGECYDQFWEEENNQPTINVDELVENYKLTEWYKENTKYRIDYYYKNDLERRWKYHKTMAMAIASANLMIAKGDYVILNITTEYPSIGQG